MMYQAYTQIAEEFPTFEAAVEHLKYEPGADGKEPIAVLLLKGSNYLGAEAEEVDGAPGTEEDTQAYLITVVHDVAGNKFKIEYIVEFGTNSLRTARTRGIKSILDGSDGLFPLWP